MGVTCSGGVFVCAGPKLQSLNCWPKMDFYKKHIKHPYTYLKMFTNVINQIFIIPQIYFG